MYTTSAVRDLVWALWSAPLLLHEAAVRPEWGRAEVEQNRDVLARLDAPDSALQHAVASRATNRLGEYFEVLIATWLTELPSTQVLCTNLQVHSPDATIGEFDLVFTRDGTTHHWELAVKYYLGYPEPGGRHWIGPNARDDLGAKWDRMRGKQLTLSEHPLGRESLRGVGATHPVAARALVKGCLFEALNPAFATRDHPDVNPDAPRGFWVHRRDLLRYAPDVPPGTRWLALDRLRWMADPVVGADEHPVDIHDLAPRHPGDAVFVAGFCEGERGWRPVGRGFVVDDRWPQT